MQSTHRLVLCICTYRLPIPRVSKPPRLKPRCGAFVRPRTTDANRLWNDHVTAKRLHRFVGRSGV